MSIFRPVVLCFSGHDPSGGAGIQADIETLISHQCHAASIITVLTDQNTQNVKRLIPQKPEHIIAQANTLLADMSVQAFKIGLIGDYGIVQAIHEVLKQYPSIPVVLDPVLAAGGGTQLANAQLITAIDELLLPHAKVLTPNSEEARKLTGLNNLQDCGLALLDKGCDYVLITGTHEESPSVSNQLFHGQRCWETYTWNRLPDSYHGSGCTLASSIAALLAHGVDPVQAISEAQEYTWNTLNHAYRPGKGQHNPNRLFWMEPDR